MYYDPFGLFGMDSVWSGVYSVTGGWSPSQSTVDYAAGFGDGMTGNITNWIRDQLDVNSSVDKCSDEYNSARWTGVGFSFAFGAAGAARGFGWSVNFNKYKHGGGGVNFMRNGDRKFGADWHSFKYKGNMVNRPHYHRGKSKNQKKKHRPWQGGW